MGDIILFYYFKILGDHDRLNAEGKVALVKSLITEYRIATGLGTPREASERIVGDDLILLAARIIEEILWV